MNLLPTTLNLNFMRWGREAAVLSIAMMVISLASLAWQGLKLGIDFSGGVLIEVGYTESPELQEVRNTLEAAGFSGAVVQFYGTSTDVLVRLMPQQGAESDEVADTVLKALTAQSAGAQMRRVEFVGPQVGKELTEKGGTALLYALGLIFVYVLLRFHWKFSAGAVAALIHDVIITVGAFSLFQWEFDLTVLAAVLAVIGYSLNDTIVVFDRARENLRILRKRTPVEIMNISINQTLSRTVMTGVTTLLVLMALFLLGGKAVAGFSLALIIGILVGTYSSIFVAGNLAIWLGVEQADLMPPEKEDDDPAKYV